MTEPAQMGTDLITIERARQKRSVERDGEGWSAEHDAGHDGAELLGAADCYLAFVYGPESSPCFVADDYVEAHWPWHPSWWRPSDDPVRNLVKAGALIAAEIDRRQARE
jgi:hypothetical protein